MAKNIDVLVVDDSLLFREVLSLYVNQDENIRVIGKAANPIEALELLEKLEPDVITLDMEMPQMNGVDFLKKLLPERSIPVVVVSSAAEMAFKALDVGAVDYVKKPKIKNADDLKKFADKLCNIIKAASVSSVKGAKEVKSVRHVVYKPDSSQINSVNPVIAIGASTGGVDAIARIINALPSNMPPILITQHMPEKFTEMFANRLNVSSKLDVKEAQDGDRLRNGLVIVAAGKYHMRLEKDASGYYITSEKGEKVNGHCPSVGVLFDSVAKAAGRNALGIILTGMGSDGAKELCGMRNAGAYTIGQDKESCIVYGMPMVAYNLGGVCKQCSLDSIPDEIIKYLKSYSKEKKQ